ncbi:uncharacterized protein LOC143294740 [Babylonia areolata]|uniref:uncharacterized protein LOC143294740 n=1 Tax=Babylonia areolata TaxID=304850 RepID=UPI003FD5295C
MLRPVEGADRRVRVDPDGTLHLPAGCDLLTHLYANHGVRVRLVRRPPPPKREKIPTVRQLIDHLSHKHQLLLSSDTDLASKSSSSTPTVPLSSSQRVYGSGDGAGPSPHPGSSQEVVGGGIVGWEHRTNDLQKLKELDIHGSSTRPLSNRKEKGPVDQCQGEVRPLASCVSGSKQLPQRANGIKNNVLRADHIHSQRSCHGATGQEEDLLAMGTLWSPNPQLHIRGSASIAAASNSTTTTAIITSSASHSSSKSLSNSIVNGSGSGSGVFTSPSATLPARRPVPGATSTLHTVHPSSAVTALAMGNVVKSKDADPKYSDPVPGAPPSFQQRLMELAALEAETVRWERSKKVKKKPLKQDKDS